MMWICDALLENHIEADGSKELDEKRNDNPVRLVGKTDTVDDDLDCDEDEGDEDGMALVPFEPDDYTTPGEGYRVLPCPAKLPHDLQVGGKLAQWFAHPYNAWHVGTIHEVNKRRTKTENVSVRFISEEEGETRGTFVADAETYGVDKLWVALEPIPVEVGSSSPEDSEHEGSD